MDLFRNDNRILLFRNELVKIAIEKVFKSFEDPLTKIEAGLYNYIPIDDCNLFIIMIPNEKWIYVYRKKRWFTTKYLIDIHDTKIELTQYEFNRIIKRKKEIEFEAKNKQINESNKAFQEFINWKPPPIVKPEHVVGYGGSGGADENQWSSVFITKKIYEPSNRKSKSRKRKTNKRASKASRSRSR